MAPSEKEFHPKCAVVLAAGRGTRMKSDLPKVLLPLSGRSMILHVIDHLIEAGIRHILIVVGYKKELVIDSIPRVDNIKIEFVEQKEQRGTAHALLSAESALQNFSGSILVTNGDMPLIQAKTFRDILAFNDNFSATVLSSEIENPFGYGRIVRDEKGNLLKIVEEKDANESIRRVREINTGTYVFRSPEIFNILHEIDSHNSQNEFYLTDAISLLRKKMKIVGSFLTQNSDEALGANSLEDLELLEKKSKVGAIQ